MRAAHQPPPDAPLDGDAKSAVMAEAVREVVSALEDTINVLAEVAQLVLDFLEEPEEFDKDALKAVCERAIVFTGGVRDQFSLKTDEVV